MAVAALAAGACGDGGVVGPPPSERRPSSTAATSDQPTTTVLRSAPRWESVTTLMGTGTATTEKFRILADSIQWRARWTCHTGRLQIKTDPPPRRAKPLIDEACPGRGEGFSVVSGEVRLNIVADGPWELRIDQQVDTPLQEPPFEGMAAAPVLRQGAFYPVEKEAKGTARLYQRADGTLILRLEDLEVTNNVDLFVWVSEAASPHTSAEAVAAPHTVLGNLKATVGSQSYVLPADLPVANAKSIVIWCEPIAIAYGAAALS